jgi:tetratricopeptide (TPR) repeat protein
MLDTVYHLGNLYSNQGKLVDAEEWYRRALAGFAKASCPDYKSSLNTLYALGSLYVRQGLHDNGQPLLERAVAGYKMVYGPNYRYTLGAMSAIEDSLRQPSNDSVTTRIV